MNHSVNEICYHGAIPSCLSAPAKVGQYYICLLTLHGTSGYELASVCLWPTFNGCSQADKSYV